MRESTSTLDEATSAAVAVIHVLDSFTPDYFDALLDRDYAAMEIQLTRAIRRVLDGERYTALGVPTAAQGLDRRSRECQGAIDAALPAEGYRLHLKEATI